MKKLRERQDRLDHDWGLEIVRKKRKALIRSVPIMSDEITKLDNWLVTQPHLPLRDLIDIWARSTHVDWVKYGDASPDLKHLILLRLEGCFEEFQKLPPRWQKKLWPIWERWRAEFMDQEQEEAANG
jgi:hypothetical protein